MYFFFGEGVGRLHWPHWLITRQKCKTVNQVPCCHPSRVTSHDLLSRNSDTFFKKWGNDVQHSAKEWFLWSTLYLSIW